MSFITAHTPAVRAFTGPTSRGVIVDATQAEGRAFMRGMLDRLGGPAPVVPTPAERLAQAWSTYRFWMASTRPGKVANPEFIVMSRAKVRAAVAAVRAAGGQ